MSNNRTYLCALAYIFICACSKQQFAPLPPNTPAEKPVGADAFGNISAAFNDELLAFTTTKNENDTFSNASYRLNYTDYITLNRYNDNQTIDCRIRLVNTRLENISLPYTLPDDVKSNDEYADIIVTDYCNKWNEYPDNYFIENSYKGFQVIITDTSGGEIKGLFRGKARSKSGKILDIQNGYFDLNLINVNKN